jgi:hypothetical protein
MTRTVTDLPVVMFVPKATGRPAPKSSVSGQRRVLRDGYCR